MLKLKFQWPFVAVLVTATFFLLDAIWIPVKAQVAQLLLEDAWQRTLAGEENAKPWPWADTSPVGLLEIPEKGIRQIVLSGTSGRNLAFGPTLLTSLSQKDLIISGHRDTHFSFLENLQQGETIRLTSIEGTREFTVNWLEVIDSQNLQMVFEPGKPRLTLVTCYPFDAVSAGGSLRYIVTAVPVTSIKT